jgi:Cu/Ag efflux pump CusA
VAWVDASGGRRLLLALVSTLHSGRSFLPEFNEGSLTLSAVTLPGTSLAESDALGRVVENARCSELPEVTSVARRTGRAELDEHAQGVESAELDVSIKMKERTKAAFLEALRSAFSQIPGMSTSPSASPSPTASTTCSPARGRTSR